MDKDTKTNTNTMTDDELQDMIRKGVKPKDESRARLGQYLSWRLHIYDLYEWKGTILADSFVEDFQHFDRDDFEAFKKNDIKRLRNQLRSKGVFVRVKRFLSISDVLMKAIQDELTWPEDDPKGPQSRRPLLSQTPTPPNPKATTIPTAIPNVTVPVPKIVTVSNITETTALVYGLNQRVPNLLPSPYQIMQDFGAKQNHGHSKELVQPTITTTQPETQQKKKKKRNEKTRQQYKQKQARALRVTIQIQEVARPS